MKKIISTIIALIVALVSITVLFSCDDTGDKTNDSTPKSEASSTNDSTKDSTADSSGNEEHKHTYENGWIAEANGHYKKATCHPDVKELQNHSDTTDRDGKCDVCQYEIKTATTFTVTVKDDMGEPIRGVQIKIYTSSSEKTVTTNEEGNASCEFIYFDTVRAIVKSMPQGYENIVDNVYDFSNNTVNIEASAMVFYKLVFHDDNGEGVEGVKVEFKTSSTTVESNEKGEIDYEILRKELNGEKQSVRVTQLPKGLALLEEELNTYIDIDNNSETTIKVISLVDYTVSAKKQNGEPFANAVFEFSKDGELVEKVVTDKNGTAVVTLPKGEYSVTISHLNVFYKPDKESTTVTTENNSYEATFTESKERDTVWISVFYEDGTKAEPGQVHVYGFRKDGIRDCDLLGINSKGMAAINTYNEDSYYIAVDRDENYGFVIFEKDDPTDFTIIIKKDTPMGINEQNPFFAQLLIDLPYAQEDMLLGHQRRFTSGESMYLKVLNALDKTFTIDGSKFTLEYKGKVIEPDENGVIRLTFTDVAYGEDAVFKITATEDATEDMRIEYEGAKDRPIMIYCDSIEEASKETVTIKGVGQAKYYYFEYRQDITYKLTVTAEGADVTIEYIDGDTAEGYTGIQFKVIGKEIGEVTLTFSVEEIEAP